MRGGFPIVNAVNTILGKSLNANFIAVPSDSVAMSMRQQLMMGFLAITLVAMLGATAARDMAPRGSRASIWLDSSVPDELLSARLNLTNIVKTPRIH